MATEAIRARSAAGEPRPLLLGRRRRARARCLRVMLGLVLAGTLLLAGPILGFVAVSVLVSLFGLDFGGFSGF